MRTTAPVLLLALAASGCMGNDLEVYRAFFSTEPCDGAPTEACNYANVFFVLRQDGVAVSELSADHVSMNIDGRDVGVEGQKRLTNSNGLLVSLLLDTSYSITEAQAETGVKEAAVAFVKSLPDTSRVSVATFASEPTVPTLVCRDGTKGTESGSYSSTTGAVETIGLHYDAYDNLTSNAQTKVFDAIERWSQFRPTNPALKVLQKVMVVFTDGADTASTYMRTAKETLEEVRENDPTLKIYAIGMGNDVDAEALTTLSEGRFYAAKSAADLTAVFGDVAKDLSFIYQLRILVAQVESEAEGRLRIEYGGATYETTVEMLTSDPISNDGGGGGGGGGGGSGPMCQ